MTWKCFRKKFTRKCIQKYVVYVDSEKLLLIFFLCSTQTIWAELFYWVGGGGGINYPSVIIFQQTYTHTHSQRVNTWNMIHVLTKLQLNQSEACDRKTNLANGKFFFCFLENLWVFYYFSFISVWLLINLQSWINTKDLQMGNY